MKTYKVRLATFPNTWMLLKVGRYSAILSNMDGSNPRVVSADICTLEKVEYEN